MQRRSVMTTDYRQEMRTRSRLSCSCPLSLGLTEDFNPSIRMADLRELAIGDSCHGHVRHGREAYQLALRSVQQVPGGITSS